MAGTLSDEEDRLLVHAGPSRLSSRPTSRPSSRAGRSAPSSQNSSIDMTRSKLRTSHDESRPMSSLSRSRIPSPEDDEAILFKVPGGDDDHLREDDEQGLSAPLLPGNTDSRRRISIELEELERAEGPATGVKGTLMDGIANMANSIMGAGIVGLPYAISQAGFVTGVTLLIALAILTDWTIRLVVVNAKLSGRDSYFGVMHHCFGPAGSAAVSFFQFAFAFGGMCAFNVIIYVPQPPLISANPTGDSIPHVIAFIFPSFTEHAVLRWLVDRHFIIVLITILVSFPLSLHRDIAKLSKSSSFALVSMMVIVSAVVLRGVAVEQDLKGTPSHVFSFIRPGVFEAIGVISFAFVCHHNTMFIYQSIETPTLDRFYAVTHVSTSMSLICCLLMAVTGYVVFTDKTQGNILNNFSPDDLIINVARFCFGANMSTTIPLENYVCREVIEDTLFHGKPFSQRRHVISTIMVVFGAMAVSLLTCDLGVVLEVAGGLSATALAFIFPASAYYTLTRGPWYSRQKLPAVLCAGFGAVVLVLSCGLTIMKAFTRQGETKQCT